MPRVSVHITQATVDDWRARIASNPVVCRLQRAAEDVLGGALLVLLREDEKVVEVESPGRPGLPEFCSLYRDKTAGLECCESCRTLMTFGACYRGTIEYSCHGGVIIIASAVPGLTGNLRVIVASCAFVCEDRETGWLELSDHAHALGVDIRKLRAAYDRMPSLTSLHRLVATAIVETAATALACQCEDSLATSGRPDPPGLPDDEPNIEEMIHSALYIAQTQAAENPRRAEGSPLVEQVEIMLRRHPQLPFSVAHIAATAGISPNYFSTLFRRVVGSSFTEYLLEHRITLAQGLLRDLTLPIEQVALRSGFPNAGYFTRRFRKATGMSPSEWRKHI